MRRLVVALALGYLVLAIAMKVKEAAGLLRCDCYPDCWCRRPGLSVFRWVFPRFHRNPAVESWTRRQVDAVP